MTRYVRTLAEVSAADLALVGGKGANLGELVRAGAPVPAAFCVTTEAYRAFLARSDLGARIAGALRDLDHGDPAQVEAAGAAIRTAFLAAPTPEAVAEGVAAAYAALEADLGPRVPVSVRSSATAEDLPGTSFAGQQDTYLHIAGREEVAAAVQRCWASLWTARAISYRHVQGFDGTEVLLAVVVQEMFPSEVSGVLFTANPLTSNPRQWFLNASWGLGEAVVSGQVNPDQLVVDKGTLEVVDRQVQDKLRMTVPDPTGQGSATVAVPEERRRSQALPDPLVRDLCLLGQRIEDHMGFPQDIEWGWAGGRFAILQAREITGANLDFAEGLEAWKTPAALASMYDERWVWSRAYSDEVQTGPTTPSFYTYLQLGMTHLKALALTLTGTTRFLDYEPGTYLDVPYFRWYGARAYYNLAFERERIRRFIPPFARDEAALWPFPEEERADIRDLPFDWPEFHALLRRLQDTNPEVSLLGTTRVLYEHLERWTDEEDAFWAAFDLQGKSVAEIFAAQAASRGESRFGLNVVLPFTIYLYFLPQALQTVCTAWFGDEGGTMATRLLGGLHTKTGEENVAVWQLSRAARASDRLVALIRSTPNDEIIAELGQVEGGPAFLEQLERFLATYGHRGGAERDAYHERWRHRPGLVFDALRPLLGLGDDESPEQHQQRLHAQMLATKAAAVERLRDLPLEGSLDWLVELNRLADRPAADRAELFTWFVELVQDYVYYRDFERFYNDKTMSRSRDLYAAIARRFVAAGLLTDPDDVFFLGRDELALADRGGLTPRQIELRVRSRRAVYERYSKQEPPKYLRGWQAFDDHQLDADGTLRGIGASAGLVTGRARVCRELAQIGRVERGDILVTVATDPGWTTVFSIIGGVVVETGGVVAHAVMISREYGLPCVANLSRACDHIPDGATVTVDGTTGRVLVHEPDGTVGA